MLTQPKFEHLTKWSELGVQTNTSEKSPAPFSEVRVASNLCNQH